MRDRARLGGTPETKYFIIGLAGEKISKKFFCKFSQIMVPRFQKCEKKFFEQNFEFFFRIWKKYKKKKSRIFGILEP